MIWLYYWCPLHRAYVGVLVHWLEALKCPR